MTVSDLLKRVSSLELAEWMAFYRLEPFGEERDDLRTGIVASTVAETARDTKRRRRPYRPKDFMPQFDRMQQTWEQQLAVVEMMNRALGGKDLRRKQ